MLQNDVPFEPRPHVIGSSYLKFSDIDQCSYVYVNIPKNASNWITYHFEGINYNYTNQKFFGPVTFHLTTDDIEKYLRCQKYIVVLRDPLERWISGFAQYSLGWDPEHPNFIKNVKFKEVLDQMVFDDHTRPQCDFISDIPLDNITWFKCKLELNRRFTHFMLCKYGSEKYLEIKDDAENRFNVSSKVPAREFHKLLNKPGAPAEFVTMKGMSQQEIINYIKSVFDRNPKYVEYITQFYQDDYRLIDSANFYTAS